MGLKVLAGVGAVFGLLAAGSARAQSSPEAPTDRWELRQTGESCYLTRSFPNGDDRLELRIQSFGPTTGYHFVLIGKGLPIRKDRAVLARVGFGGETAAKDVIALAGNSGSLPAAVFVVAHGPVAMLTWYYSYRQTDATSVIGLDPTAQELFVDFEDMVPVTLHLGQMSEEYGRLDDCAEAVVTKLGAASSPTDAPIIPPKLLEGQTVNFRVKYPDNLVLNRISGLVEMRMTVDEGGKVHDCVPQMTIWVPQFGTDACHEMERWAHFGPARDAQGKPVSAMYRIAAMYLIYNW